MKHRYPQSAAAIALAFLAVCSDLSATEATGLSASDIQQGWILLFDGQSMFGWSQAGGSGWRASANTLTASGSGSAWLRTNSPFSDFAIRLEYSLPADGQAFLILRANKEGSKNKGYRIPLADGDPQWPAGSVIHHLKAKAVHPAPDLWHSLTVTLSDNALNVAVDGVPVAGGSAETARAGFIFLERLQGVGVAVRKVQLKPLYSSPIFNGADLEGWKAVSLPPRPARSHHMLGKLPDLFSVKSRPKDAKWSVRSGTIQGEGGIGELESTKTYENVVMQFAGNALPGIKSHSPKASIFLRGDPGKPFSGYELPLVGGQPASVRGLASPRSFPPSPVGMVETVVLAERHFQIWNNGFPVTDFVDTRPEGSDVTKAAKIAAGTIALPDFDDDGTVEYLSLHAAPLQVPFGGAEETGPQIPTPDSSAIVSHPAAISSASAPVLALSSSVLASAPSPSIEQENRQKSALIMSQALRSNNPEEQMRLYDQVVRLDPSNSAAAQGYKDAQQQLDAHRQTERKWEGTQVDRLQQEHSNELERDSSLLRAQEAFVKGDLGAAQRSLSVAQRLAPNNPSVTFLASSLSHAQRVRSQIWMVSAGGGLLAVTGALVYLLRRRGEKRAVVQVLSGSGAGKKYDLIKDKIAIGSVVRDGESRNDIVVTDSQHMVSRFHCEIHRREKNYFLIDCQSANGTWLDQRPLVPGKPSRLKRGSRIELGGQVALRFELKRLKKA